MISSNSVKFPPLKSIQLSPSGLPAFKKNAVGLDISEIFPLMFISPLNLKTLVLCPIEYVTFCDPRSTSGKRMCDLILDKVVRYTGFQSKRLKRRVPDGWEKA